jgi:F-type H+-transporting ATPase subunit b
MGAIGINWQVLLAQLITFGVLFFLLANLLYKPMRRMLDQRSAKIKESMEQAEQIKLQLANTEQQVKEQIDNARKEGQGILAQAAQLGERFKEEAKVEARKEAENIVAKARTEIERERDKAIAEVRREFVDLTIKAAEKVVKETLDKEKHRRLIEDVLEQASKGDG